MSSSSRSNSPEPNVKHPPPTSHRARISHRVTDDSPSPNSTAPSNLRGSPTPSSGTGSSAPGVKKRHVCTTCQKSFTTSGHLSRHTRVHTGERNHKCPFPGCETRCSRQDNLQQHYRIHLSPGSRRTSGSSTRSALARALGADGNSVKKRGSKYAVFTAPPPLPESPPSTPPPLVQAYPVHTSSLDAPPSLAPAHATVPISIPPVQDFHSDGSSSSPDSRYESESPLVHAHAHLEKRPSPYTFTPVTEPSFEQPSGGDYSYYSESHSMSRGTYHGQSYSGYSTSNLSPAPLSIPSQRGSMQSGTNGEDVFSQQTSAHFIPSQHYSQHPSYPVSHAPSHSPSPASSHYSSYGSTQASSEYSMHGAINHSPLMHARGVYGLSHNSRVDYSAGPRYSSPMPGVSHLHNHYPSMAPSEMV